MAQPLRDARARRDALPLPSLGTGEGFIDAEVVTAGDAEHLRGRVSLSRTSQLAYCSHRLTE